MLNSDQIELKSSLVTQTIEVMKQTEVLQSLIDTYSNKNVSSVSCMHWPATIYCVYCM